MKHWNSETVPVVCTWATLAGRNNAHALSVRGPGTLSVTFDAKDRMGLMGDSKKPDGVHTSAGTASDPGSPDSTELELDLEDAFSEDGVDLTLIRWMLQRTPIERLQAAQQLIDAAWALRTDSEA